jgi:hypothetical protein
MKRIHRAIYQFVSDCTTANESVLTQIGVTFATVNTGCGFRFFYHGEEVRFGDLKI